MRPGSGPCRNRQSKVLNRIAPQPGSLQEQLLEALGLTPPEAIPEGKVSVDTRTKLQHERK